MGILSNIFGTGSVSVDFTGENGVRSKYTVDGGTTAGAFVGRFYASFNPDVYTLKVVQGGVKKEITGDYVLQNADHISAVIPKNVAGA